MLTHLYEVVRQRAESYPNAIAIGGQQGLVWKALSGSRLLELVDRLADELTDIGVSEGDRVVIWLPNQWRTPVYLFALWKLGAVIVPFDREMNPEGGALILDSVEPRCIIVGYGERPAWARGRQVTEWWEPGVERHGDAATRRHDDGAMGRRGDDLATIVFTSGTTGVPKGCMITHANLCAQIDQLYERVPLDASCRMASILPLSHLFELTAGLIYPLWAGVAIHYIPSRRPPDILRVLFEQRITHMTVVPQLLTIMGQALDQQLKAVLRGPLYEAVNALAKRLSLPARRRLFWMVHRKLGGQLRLMIVGGAPLAAETQMLWERLGVRIVQGYGTSECSPSVACGLPDGSTPMGTVGKALKGVELRLSPEGELMVRGPNVMRGYWKDPERTAEVLKDGWYATGDLATIDGDGNVRLAGRAKDLIALPSGMKVWPQDVEDVLRSNPAVKDAALVAVPTPGGGAKLHAYLIPNSTRDRETDLGALVAESNARLALHQRLASASWWSEADFPRTSTLKLRRNLLPMPEDVEAVKVESVLAADDPVGQAVAGVAGVSAVEKDQTLGSLGLDSLGLVELALALEEKSGKAVADGDLRLEMTVEQVRGFVAGLPGLEAGPAQARKGGRETISTEHPMWPYTWGRIFRRPLSLPIDLLYRVAVSRTIVLGDEHLDALPGSVIFAGTHHSYPDLPVVRHALIRRFGWRLGRRLMPAMAAGNFVAGRWVPGGLRPHTWYGILALGTYPLRQLGEREASLRGLVKAAMAGNVVVIFPQGTHVKPELERAGDPAVRFRAGVAHLAEALHGAVVPFGLAGTETMIPRDPAEFEGPSIGGIPLSLKRGPLVIAFGTPLTFQASESPEAFTVRLQQVCYSLTRQAERALNDSPQRTQSTLR